MGKIHLLDTKIANMIAAGEVVERPSGVVKELVENAIDAKATKITIHLLQGGIKEINIIDDGIGMNADDLSMAFKRHATSKISVENDLWNIHTLGFRGEALPSIAAVSDVIMRSSDGNDANEIHIVNGEQKSFKKTATNKGTQIIVRDLFFALPARLKHLKSTQYEFGAVLDIVQKMALAYANVAFVLTHDNKEVFRTNGKGDLLNIIYNIYGNDVAKSAININTSNDDFDVNGYICLPHISRASRNHIIIFMNNRLIKSYRLQQAICDGYYKYIAEKRFPLVFINISMDPHLVDVNVHPSKQEVRLSKEFELVNLIKEAIENTLEENLHKQANLIADISVNKIISRNVEQLAFKETIVSAEKDEKKIEKVFVMPKDEAVVKEEVINSKPIEECFEDEEIIENYEENKEENIPVIPSLNVIGQLHGSYILASSDDGLVIIDQHAANERINYEKVLKLFEAEQYEKQLLLFPLTITLERKAMFQFNALQNALSSIGIDIEQFGEQDIIIRDTPLWMQVDDEKQFIIDLIESILENNTIDILKIKKKALSTIACHASVRFNASLSKEEMESTIANLFTCKNPYHCPHGRPTMITYTTKDIRKLFDRT